MGFWVWGSKNNLQSVDHNGKICLWLTQNDEELHCGTAFICPPWVQGWHYVTFPKVLLEVVKKSVTTNQSPGSYDMKWCLLCQWKELGQGIHGGWNWTISYIKKGLYYKAGQSKRSTWGWRLVTWNHLGVAGNIPGGKFHWRGGTLRNITCLMCFLKRISSI